MAYPKDKQIPPPPIPQRVVVPIVPLTPEEKWSRAFDSFQRLLSKTLTPEARLSIAEGLRDLSVHAVVHDQHIVRGILMMASSFEHGIRSDYPKLPEDSMSHLWESPTKHRR